MITDYLKKAIDRLKSKDPESKSSKVEVDNQSEFEQLESRILEDAKKIFHSKSDSVNRLYLAYLNKNKAVITQNLIDTYSVKEGQDSNYSAHFALFENALNQFNISTKDNDFRKVFDKLIKSKSLKISYLAGRVPVIEVLKPEIYNAGGMYSLDSGIILNPAKLQPRYVSRTEEKIVTKEDVLRHELVHLIFGITSRFKLGVNLSNSENTKRFIFNSLKNEILAHLTDDGEVAQVVLDERLYKLFAPHLNIDDSEKKEIKDIFEKKLITLRKAITDYVNIQHRQGVDMRSNYNYRKNLALAMMRIQTIEDLPKTIAEWLVLLKP